MREPLNPTAKAILAGGLIAGTVDIGSASLINWASPILILRAIATGLLGAASFRDGAASAFLGLFLQWIMSLIIATIFVLVARKRAVWVRRWKLWGFVYGLVIFVVMNYLVVPLSRAPFDPFIFIPVKILENLAAMILFGWIVAFCAARMLGIPPEAPGRDPSGRPA